MKLKILVVTAMYPRPGNEGSGAFVMQQVEQLRALGHAVDVYDFPGYRSKFEYLKAAVEVFRRTRKVRYSLVHAHYGVTGIPALFRSSIPLVISLHGSDALVGWIEPMISRIACRFADATIAVTDTIAKKFPGEVIPCGVDLALFEPKAKGEARQRLGLSLGRKYVLFPFDPSRPVKRHDLARAAVGRVKAEFGDVELLCVSNVHYSEMPWYYGAADAMILCSDSEGSPTSVKEALSCNLPIVTVDVGDVKEIIEGISGVAVVEQTIDSLAAALKRLLYESPGTAFDGRRAMQRYSQQRAAEAIVQVYLRTLNQRGKSVPASAGANAGNTPPFQRRV